MLFLGMIVVLYSYSQFVTS